MADGIEIATSIRAIMIESSAITSRNHPWSQELQLEIISSFNLCLTISELVELHSSSPEIEHRDIVHVPCTHSHMP